jgi:hypothetical protein
MRILGLNAIRLVFRPLRKQRFGEEALREKILAKILCDRGLIAMRQSLYRDAIKPLRRCDRAFLAKGKHSNRIFGSTFRLWEEVFGAFPSLLCRIGKTKECKFCSDTLGGEKSRLA